MISEVKHNDELYLDDFDRPIIDQVLENLGQSIRAIDLLDSSPSELCPHPTIVAKAEIQNAIRYLKEMTDAVERVRYYQGGSIEAGCGKAA
ncbi:MAG: hypothetical protein ACR2OV_07120 [Hyphomicrobiaceae bacterium]